MSEQELPPDLPQGPPPAPDDEFPEVRRRLWDLEWRLRRESGNASDRFADFLKVLFQAPAWSGEAVAEGLLPALSDMRRRIVALETKATEGTAPQHPAFVALSERVDILERLVEEGVAAQREAIAAVDDRLTVLEGRIETVEARSERIETLEGAAQEAAQHIEELSGLTETVKELLVSHDTATEALGARLDALDQQIGSRAEDIAQVAARLATTYDRLELEASRLNEEIATRGEDAGQLRDLAETTEARAQDLAERLEVLEEKGQAWDVALEETAGDLVHRVGNLETGAERTARDLADKVSAAQFAGVSLAMGTQQAAIKDIKGQIAAIRAGGQLPPLSPEDLAAIQAMQAGQAPPAADTEQVQALWEHLSRLEERIAGMMPEFDRLSKELAESKKGVKGLLSNWMELEGKLGFYAEKRHVSQLEARIPPADLVERIAGIDGMEKRVGDLEVLAIGLQEGLREIAAALTGGSADSEPMSWEDLPEE
jgi:chromosome segregation ATPase